MCQNHSKASLVSLGDAFPSKSFEGHQGPGGSPHARKGGGGEGEAGAEGGERSASLCAQRHEDGDCGKLASRRNRHQGAHQG